MRREGTEGQDRDRTPLQLSVSRSLLILYSDRFLSFIHALKLSSILCFRVSGCSTARDLKIEQHQRELDKCSQVMSLESASSLKSK